MREYSQIHIDEDVSKLTGSFENALFFNCKFGNMNGLTLKNCVLEHSQFTATKPEDMLGFTMTLDCHSFRNIELTDELFDTMLLLLCKSKGNVEKRKKIINDIVGRDRSYAILKKLEHLE